MITIERLREVLDYDPETGDLVWKKRTSYRNTVGKIAGYVAGRGQIQVRIDGHLYYAHRLIWFHVNGSWPPYGIDHKDCNPSNNRWDNLRLASQRQNSMNRRIQKNNKSGFKGVSLHRGYKYPKWTARLTLSDGTYKHLGMFDSPESAAEVYATAVERFHGEWGRVK